MQLSPCSLPQGDELDRACFKCPNEERERTECKNIHAWSFTSAESSEQSSSLEAHACRLPLLFLFFNNNQRHSESEQSHSKCRPIIFKIESKSRCALLSQPKKWQDLTERGQAFHLCRRCSTSHLLKLILRLPKAHLPGLHKIPYPCTPPRGSDPLGSESDKSYLPKSGHNIAEISSRNTFTAQALELQQCPI